MTPEGPVRTLDVKEVASLAHSAAMTGLVSRYGHDKFKLWIDPDRTKIPWGEGRRRADTTRRPYIDLGPGVEPPQLVPQVDESPKPTLLQIADIYAYTAAQAHSQKGGQRAVRFRDLYAAIDPEKAVFEWNPDVKWEDA